MSSSKDGAMIILSSPSGAGKTTLVKKISKLNNFEISISHTTRKPRINEKNGKDYFFVSKNDFEKSIKNSEFFEFSENEYINRAKNLQENSSFRSIVSHLLKEEFDKNHSFDSQEEILAEESLYKGGFFSNADKQLMDKFHKSEWSEKLKICDDFDDERLFYFGMRLIYEEQPSILPKEIFNNIHSSIANQVLSMNNEKWYTIPKACKDSDDLKAKFENENDFEKLAQLKKFDLLIDQIQSKLTTGDYQIEKFLSKAEPIYGDNEWARLRERAKKVQEEKQSKQQFKLIFLVFLNIQ